VTYLGVQALSHLNAAGGDRDGAIALVDADVAVDRQREVVDGVLAWHKGDAAFAPHVFLKCFILNFKNQNYNFTVY
jgi:hypothetical protein